MKIDQLKSLLSAFNAKADADLLNQQSLSQQRETHTLNAAALRDAGRSPLPHSEGAMTLFDLKTISRNRTSLLQAAREQERRADALSHRLSEGRTKVEHSARRKLATQYLLMQAKKRQTENAQNAEEEGRLEIHLVTARKPN